jgi:bacterioferritin
MDREKLVELLNGDLELEFRSIVQYTQHAATVKGVEFQPIADKIRPHLRQELEHATVLAEQIDFLGGEPTTHVPEVPNQTEPRRALAPTSSSRAPAGGVPGALRASGGTGAPGRRRGLRPLLEQTQDHVRDLRSALGEGVGRAFQVAA